MKCDAPNPVRCVIGCNIRFLRKRQQIKQEDFADMIGISRSYLSQIENGLSNATIDVYAKIADGLDAPLPDLLKGLEECAPGRLPLNVTYAAVQLP